MTATSIRSEGAAIHQEEDTPADARLHEPIDLVDHGKGLAGAGRHRDQHLALVSGDSLFNRSVCFDLIGPQLRMVVGMSGEPPASALEIASQKFFESRWRVKVRDRSRATEGVADVVKPKDFAVGGVEERDPKPAKVEGAVGNAP